MTRVPLQGRVRCCKCSKLHIVAEPGFKQVKNTCRSYDALISYIKLGARDGIWATLIAK